MYSPDTRTLKNMERYLKVEPDAVFSDLTTQEQAIVDDYNTGHLDRTALKYNYPAITAFMTRQERPASVPSDHINYQRIVNETLPKGGGTYVVDTGNPITRNTGYIVGAFPELTFAVPPAGFTAVLLKEAWQVLKHHGRLIGTWYDETTGKVEIQVAMHFDQVAAATAAARRNKQRFIYNVRFDANIPVPYDAAAEDRAWGV